MGRLETERRESLILKMFGKKFILLHFFCLQEHAPKENSVGGIFNFIMLIFSNFNWKLMELFIHIKNELKSVY